MINDVRVKYILGNEAMELAEKFGSDLFDAWIVSQIDKLDDILDKNPDNEYATLAKEIYQQVRDAYHDLKK